MISMPMIQKPPLARRARLCGLAAAFVALHAGAVQAQSFPEREVRIIVPFAPGGTGDSVARIVAEAAQGELGVPMIIENQPGGASNTGTERAADAAPDGYTLLVQSDTLTTNPLVYPNAGYDAQTSFEPIITIARVPVVLAVRKDLEADTVEEFVALLRERPGEITVGTPSVGGGNHLTGLLFKDGMEVDWTDVPYPGAGPAVTDLVGGHVDAMWSMAAPLMAHAQSGAIKVLAVSTPERSPLLPDVPTVAETTELDDFSVENWQGLFAPAGTPPEVIETIAAAVEAGLRNETTRERLEGLGMQPGGEGGAQALREEIARSLPRWQKVIAENNVTVQ